MNMYADKLLQVNIEAMQRELWFRQIELYPTSIRITPQDVIEWALEDRAPWGVTYEQAQLRRLRAIAMALQYPVGVWYRIPAIAGTPHKVTGYRFGFDGPEYLSNFSDL